MERELEAEGVGVVRGAAAVGGRVRRDLGRGRGRGEVVRARIRAGAGAGSRGAARGGGLLAPGDPRVVDEDTLPAAGGALGARPLKVALDLGSSAGLARLATGAIGVPANDGQGRRQMAVAEKSTHGSPQVRL